MADNLIQGVIEILVRGDRETISAIQRIRTEEERLIAKIEAARRSNQALATTMKASSIDLRSSLSSVSGGYDTLSKRLSVVRAGYGNLRKELIVFSDEENRRARARTREILEEQKLRAGGIVKKGLVDTAQVAATGNPMAIANSVINTAQAAAAGASLTSVVGAFGLLGGAAIAVGVASRGFFEILRAGEAGVTAAANSQRLYYETIAKGTTDSVQAQIIEAQFQKSIRDKQIAELENARNIAAQSGGVFGDFLVRLGDLTGKLGGASADAIQTLRSESLKFQTDINALNVALKDGSLAANDAAAAETKLAEERQKLNDFIVRDSIRAANSELEYRRSIASFSRQSSESLRSTGDALEQQIADQLVYISMLEQTSANSEELAAALNAAYDQLGLLRDQYSAVTGTLLQNALAEEKRRKVIDDTTKAIEESLKIREQLSDLEAARADQLERRRTQALRDSQVGALEERIAAARLREAEQERQDRIAKVRADAVKQEAADRAKLGSSIKKLNDNFFASELKALSEFRLNEARINEDAARARLRKLEDLEAELTDLAGSGDVVAFIKAQRDGLKDIRRTDEDQGVDTQRRFDDFQTQRREAANARNEQLRDLIASFDEERRARQQEARERINQELAAGQQRLKQSEVLQQQLSELRAKFAEEDTIRQRQAEDTAFAKQKAALEKRQNELIPIIRKGAEGLAEGAKTFLNSVAGGVVDMITRIRSASQAKTGGTKTATTNEFGGIYTTPTFAQLGEVAGKGDIVIPFRQSEGIVPALERVMQRTGGRQGGSGMTVVINATVGDVATETKLHAVESDLVTAFEAAYSALQTGNPGSAA